MSTSHSSAPICIHCAPSRGFMIIPFSDFATWSLRRRTGVYWSARGRWKGSSRGERTQPGLVPVQFYRKMSLLPSTLHLLLLPGTARHCLVLFTGTLLNCSLARLSNKSQLNGWMISTIRQHLEGILVLFHSGSSQEGETHEGDDALALYILTMWCWTTSLCFTVDGNKRVPLL